MLFGARRRRILAYREPVDMRKSFNGLIGVVQNVLREDPLSETLFLFINRRSNYVKILAWDRTGFTLFAKRLESGRFRLPSEATRQELTDQALMLLLDGIPLGRRRKMR